MTSFDNEDTSAVKGVADQDEPKFSLAKVKAAAEGVNKTIIDILPPQLKEKVPPNAPVLQGLGAFLGLYLMIGYGAQFLCNFVGFLYPAYASVKAIESKEKDDDTKWLTYWVVYSAFSLVEFFADLLLFWVPFYWFFKCCFLVYCMVPTSWNGSITIYHKVIRPFVLKNQERIDKAIDDAAEVAGKFVREAEGVTRDAVAEGARAYAASSKSD